MSQHPDLHILCWRYTPLVSWMHLFVLCSLSVDDGCCRVWQCLCRFGLQLDQYKVIAVLGLGDHYASAFLLPKPCPNPAAMLYGRKADLVILPHVLAEERPHPIRHQVRKRGLK